MKFNFKSAALFAAFAFLTLCTKAQKSDSVAVRQTAEKFILAFNDFNWKEFRSAFTDDATIFFPEWEMVSRKSGKKEMEEAWLKIFPEFTDSSNTFKLSIQPKDVLIQLYDKTAIVTFHLGSGEKYLARRTLVMLKKENEWKIAHLHASYIMAPGEK